ncbi:MAG: acyl carrier protein [Anaerolineales bacterium]|nr:acyl carrier protein [Anaerolineales bacterium]
MEKIIKTLTKYITKEILKDPDKEFDADEPLLSSDMINSLSLIDLSLFIEDKFDVVLDDSELNEDTFDTIEELAKLIDERM